VLPEPFGDSTVEICWHFRSSTNFAYQEIVMADAAVCSASGPGFDRTPSCPIRLPQIHLPDA
jgi:hypothetical protein